MGYLHVHPPVGELQGLTTGIWMIILQDMLPLADLSIFMDQEELLVLAVSLLLSHYVYGKSSGHIHSGLRLLIASIHGYTNYDYA